MKVPIACTLGAEDAAGRVEEWRVALSGAVTAVSRPDPGRAELRLISEPGAIATLIDLARREKACCPFFGFAFEVEDDGLTFAVSVPDDATGVLDEFSGLVG